MEKFTIPPDQAGYSFVDATEVLFTQLDGGAGRYRTDILNGAKRMNVSWTFNPDGYNYFRVFYNVFSNKGATPFLMDLYLDDPFQLTTHECRIIPGSVKLTQQRGQMFQVSAQLEVNPIVISPDNPDGAIIIITTQDNEDLAAMYGAFGDEFPAYETIFDNLVTYEFPQGLA